MEDEKKIEKKVNSPSEGSLILNKISELLTNKFNENKKEKNLFFKKLKCFYNIHKLILSSMIVASKYNEDDEFYSHKFYAKLGGVSQAEVFNLEYNFVTLLDFNLYVSEELYCKYYDYLFSSDDDDDNYDFDDDTNINND